MWVDEDAGTEESDLSSAKRPSLLRCLYARSVSENHWIRAIQVLDDEYMNEMCQTLPSSVLLLRNLELFHLRYVGKLASERCANWICISDL